MGERIIVDPAKVKSTADSIEEHAAEYKRLYLQLYNEVDLMAKSWSGTDNVAYTSQIKGFQENFTNMHTLLTEYVEFLRTSYAAYTQTQDAIGQSAKTLPR